MRVPKKRPKKLPKNRFGDAFWSPKPLQNRKKIVSKSMLKKSSKKKAKKTPRRPTGETCLSKEREEREIITIVAACNIKLENRFQKKRTRKKGSNIHNIGMHHVTSALSLLQLP